MAIYPPDPNLKMSLARRLVESVVVQIPIAGAPLVALYSVTHRTQAEMIVEKWQRELCSTVNDHDARIKQIERAITELILAVEISSEASAIALVLSKSSVYGHGYERFDLGSLKEDFPAADHKELVEFCGELAHLGLVELESLGIGSQEYSVKPLTSLFEVFDPIAFEGRDVRRDAAFLANHLADNEHINSREFIDESGWSYRRYNPALSIVCQMLSERRISRTVYQEFYSGHCFTTPHERAALREFARNEERRVMALGNLRVAK